MITKLNVPYRDKDIAKAYGARWDAYRKVWYAPEGADITKFKSWMNSEGTPSQSEIPFELPKTVLSEERARTDASYKSLRIDLSIPKQDRARAKCLGAKWDGSKKQTWYVNFNDRMNLEDYRAWIVTSDNAKATEFKKKVLEGSVDARIREAIRSGKNTILVGVTVGDKYKPSTSTECPF